MKIYFDFRDWWVGYYRGTSYHFICPLPTLVIRWKRKPPYGFMWQDDVLKPVVDIQYLKSHHPDSMFWITTPGKELLEKINTCYNAACDLSEERGCPHKRTLECPV